MDKRELAQLVVAPARAATELRAQADRLRRETVGDEVHLRGLIEFSSFCRCSCSYCGLRADNTALPRYRMTPAQVLETARYAERLGCGTVVLQSGEDEWFTADRVARLVAEIKTRTDLAVTLALGERDRETCALWRQAGADRYLLKHETADPDLYARLHPGHTLATRLRCLEDLFDLGYQVGTGCIIGLPGQTPEILAEDLLLMRRLGVHMAGCGPLVPHPQTPLSALPPGSAEVALNVVALSRLLLPDLLIPATTALETTLPGGRVLALQSGANVIMPNFTPREFSGLYEIYPGKVGGVLPVEEELARARAAVREAGRTLAQGPGHSLRRAAGEPAPPHSP